jgi:hypothetical protein
MRAIWAFNFIETARPALSSSGEVIFEPDDRRARDLLNIVLEAWSNVALDCADVFVLMTILTPSMSHPLRGFSVYTTSLPWDGPFKRRPSVYSFQLFAAAGRRYPTVQYRFFTPKLES